MNRMFGMLCLGCLFLFTAGVQPVLAGQAEDTLKRSVDEVLSVLRNSKRGDPGRMDRLSKAVTEVFDGDELAKRTLASQWQKFSPDEQKRFTAAFVKLLQNTYLRRMDAYTNERVVFLDEAMLSDKQAEVSTKIVSDTKEIPIVYRMIKKNDWKVYDVVIEGVSLVENYREQFAQFLTRESPAQLIGRVESMNASG